MIGATGVTRGRGVLVGVGVAMGPLGPQPPRKVTRKPIKRSDIAPFERAILLTSRSDVKL